MYCWGSWEFPLALWVSHPTATSLVMRCYSAGFMRCWNLPSTNSAYVILFKEGFCKRLIRKVKWVWPLVNKDLILWQTWSLEHKTRAIFLYIYPGLSIHHQCPSAWFKLPVCQKQDEVEKALFTPTTKGPNYCISNNNHLRQEFIIFRFR